MTLNDFSFSGFVDFSRVMMIASEKEAKKIAKFIDYEQLLETFRVNGPGKYYVHAAEGWDRGGDMLIRNVMFIPADVLTVTQTLAKLKDLQKQCDKTNEAFCIAEELADMGLPYEEAVATLTPKKLKIYESMDVEAHDQNDCNLTNFMNGFDLDDVN